MVEKLIENEQYEEALKILADKNDELSLYQKIICLYSLKRFGEARLLCEEVLEGTQKYFYEIKSLYLSILLDLEEEELALKILEEELEMPYIPYEYDVRFNELYDELIQKRALNSKVHSPFATLNDEDFSKLLMETTDDETLIILMNELESRNIRKYLSIVKSLLKDKNISRIIKTILIEILIIQEVSQKFTIITKEDEYEINPIEMVPVFEQEGVSLVEEEIEKTVGNKDISFLNYCEEILYTYLGNLYPVLISKDNIKLIAGAIIIYVSELQMINEINDLEIAAKLGISLENLMTTYNCLAKTLNEK